MPPAHSLHTLSRWLSSMQYNTGVFCNSTLNAISQWLFLPAVWVKVTVKVLPSNTIAASLSSPVLGVVCVGITVRVNFTGFLKTVFPAQTNKYLLNAWPHHTQTNSTPFCFADFSYLSLKIFSATSSKVQFTIYMYVCVCVCVCVRLRVKDVYHVLV